MERITGFRVRFSDREDILRELINGADARYWVGFECDRCGRMHVADFNDRLTTFSDRRLIQTSPVVELTVEHVDDFKIPESTCPNDGTPMTPVRTIANQWLFTAPQNKDRFPSKSWWARLFS